MTIATPKELDRALDEASNPEDHTEVRGYEVDLRWPDRHLIVELDGWTTHSSRAAFERDRRKDADRQLAGLRVRRVTHRQLADEPLALVARLAKALQAIRPRHGPLVN